MVVGVLAAMTMAEDLLAWRANTSEASVGAGLGGVVTSRVVGEEDLGVASVSFYFCWAPARARVLSSRSIGR